jgi:hypothetical protein
VNLFLTKNLDKNLPTKEKLRFRGFIYGALILSVILLSIILYRVYSVVKMKAVYSETPALVLSRANVDGEKQYQVRLLNSEKRKLATLTTQAELQPKQLLMVSYLTDSDDEVFYDDFFITDYFIIAFLIVLLIFMIKGHADPNWILTMEGSI